MICMCITMYFVQQLTYLWLPYRSIINKALVGIYTCLLGRSSKRIQDVQCDKGGLDLEEQRVSRPDNSLTCFSLYRFVGTNVYFNGF